MVTGVRRMGKRIVWELEDDLFLVFHLMIAGRYHWKKPRGSSYGAASRWLAGCRAWRGWQILELPEEEKYFRNAVGSTQWVVKPDGDLLVPVAHSKPGGLWSVTVMQFKFDGEEMRYAGHGNELRVPAPRGLIEPSLIEFQGRYYLTLRNPVTGYVTSSDK